MTTNNALNTFITSFINDNTMATASATSGATSSSIKTYVDNSIGGISLTSNVRSFVSGSGTYTPTTNTAFIIVEMCGGGGGSGGVSVSANAGAVIVSAPGGAGNYYKFKMTAAQIGAGLSYSVGTGGTAGTSTPSNGGNGGNTTFGNWTAAGGTGSLANSSNTGSQTVTNTSNVAGTGQVLLNISNMQWRSDASNTLSTFFVWNIDPGGSNPFSTRGSQYVGALLTSGSGSSVLSAIAGMTQGAGAGGAARGCYSQASGAAVSSAGVAGTNGVITVTEYIFN